MPKSFCDALCSRHVLHSGSAYMQALLPVIAENQVQMRRFGLQIVGRLAEKQTSRALGFLRSQAIKIRIAACDELITSSHVCLTRSEPRCPNAASV